MKALIAAGGSGTRLRPLTFSSNKHLLPIANKPLLLYSLESIIAVGIKDVGIVVNETRPAIENLLGDGSSRGISITYIDQKRPLGLAHVAQIAKDFLAGEPFVYHLGDNIFSEGIARPFNHFVKTNPDALLTIVEHEENYRLGVPFFDESGKLVKVVEKPQNPPNKFGVPGLYFFNYHVFEAFEGAEAIKPSARGELEITDLYTYLLTHNYRVETEEVDGTWMDPGKFGDMISANRFMLERTRRQIGHASIDEASEISGEVVLSDGVEVKQSKIIGPVVIGPKTVIEHAVIGPHVSIEGECQVADAMVSNSILMEGTKINHVKTPIHDSMIGRSTEVWEEDAKSVNLFIGDHCKIRLS